MRGWRGVRGASEPRASSSLSPLLSLLIIPHPPFFIPGAFGFVVLAQEVETGEHWAIKFLERGNKITKVRERGRGGREGDSLSLSACDSPSSPSKPTSPHFFLSRSLSPQYVGRELINHSRLLHPHVIQFREVFLTDSHLAIVMEFAAGGDMFQYVKARGGLDEGDARWFFQQLVIGLDYCHRMGVVNRDIKLENTLLDGGARPLLKICDFGYSKNEKDSLPKSKVGTPGYTAPEVVSNARHYDGQAADVWSAAVMLYVMLFCEYPFERAGDAAAGVNKFARVLDRIQRVDYRFPPGIPVSDACKDLISRILVADVGARLTVEQIQAHPWYATDLPPGVTSMNEQCLALRGQSAGAQSESEIQRVVMQAIGARAAADDDVDDYIDEALEEDFDE